MWKAVAAIKQESQRATTTQRSRTEGDEDQAAAPFGTLTSEASPGCGGSTRPSRPSSWATFRSWLQRAPSSRAQPQRPELISQWTAGVHGPDRRSDRSETRHQSCCRLPCQIARFSTSAHTDVQRICTAHTARTGGRGGSTVSRGYVHKNSQPLAKEGVHIKHPPFRVLTHRLRGLSPASSFT